MIRLLPFLALLLPLNVMADFVHPMEYDHSFKQKRVLMEYIEERTRYEHCVKSKENCRNTHLRMKLSQNLRAFDEATKANNRDLMDQAIAHSCSQQVDECNYPAILKHYKNALNNTKADTGNTAVKSAK